MCGSTNGGSPGERESGQRCVPKSVAPRCRARARFVEVVGRFEDRQSDWEGWEDRGYWRGEKAPGLAALLFHAPAKAVVWVRRGGWP